MNRHAEFFELQNHPQVGKSKGTTSGKSKANRRGLLFLPQETGYGEKEADQSQNRGPDYRASDFSLHL